MDATRFPAEDPLEPLARLESQLRHSRDRLVQGSTEGPSVEDVIPASLPEPRPAVMPEPEVEPIATTLFDDTLRLEDTAPFDVPEVFFEVPEIPEIPLAPEPTAMLAIEETPSFEIPTYDPLPDAPLAAEDLGGTTVAWDVDVPVVSVTSPSIPDEELETGEPDDVWAPFTPEVLASTEPVETEAIGDAPAAEVAPLPEQDPLPVPASVLAAVAARSAPQESDAERAIADAAREVSWLARRVADGLDTVTGRLAEFETRLAELSARPLEPTRADPAPVVPVAPDPSDPTALEEWSMALARLLRADSTALRDEVHRIAEEQGVALAEVHRLTEDNGIRISGAVEQTIGRIDSAILRLSDAIGSRLSAAVASLEAAADAMRAEDQEAVIRMIDDRMEALARLLHSDSERISARLEAEIGIGREVLRAAKELQASLANDVATALDHRDRAFRASGSGSR